MLAAAERSQPLPNVTGLRCRACGREYPVEPIYACDFCFGPLEVAYDYDAIGKVVSRESIESGPRSIWRYDELLPVSRRHAVDIGAGMTPLIRSTNLARDLGLNNVWLKNDAANPTWSFKDRVVSVASTKALEFEYDVLACVSTGNLAGATAAHGAKAGMETMVFIPGDLEPGKILGAAVYGPTLVAVNGNYDQANRLCSELGDDRRWAFVNINMRPYYSEGSKTLGFEIAEQLGWKAPDHIVVPVASGSMLDQGLEGPSGVRETRADRRPQHEDAHRPGGRLRAGVAGVPGWPNPHASRDTRHRGEIPGDRGPRRRLLLDPHRQRVRRDRGHRPEPEVVQGMKLLADTEGLFTETAGRCDRVGPAHPGPRRRDKAR